MDLYILVRRTSRDDLTNVGSYRRADQAWDAAEWLARRGDNPVEYDVVRITV